MRSVHIGRTAAASILALTLVGAPLPIALAQDASPVASPAASPLASLDPAIVAGTSIPMENDQRTGVVDGPGIAGSPQVDWQTPIDEESGWLPAVGDGIVVVISRTRLNVFDRANGDLLWATPFDPDSGNPVLVDGTIYVTGLGGAFAFDAATGEQLWQFDPGLDPATEDWMPPSTTLAGDPLVMDDTVYVSGGLWGGVYALDASTGNEKWRFETAGSSPGTLSATDEGLVFSVDGLRNFANNIGESGLQAVDFTTGKSLWEIPFGPNLFSLAPVVIEDGAALVNVYDLVSGQTQVRSYDLASHELNWSTEFAPAMWIGAMSAGNGHVYVSGLEGTGVFAFDLATGALAWEHETAGSANGFAPVVDGALYVLTNDGLLQALDSSSGGVYWSLSLGEQMPFGVSGPRVAGGMIYADYGAGLVAISGDGGPALEATGGSDYPPQPAVAADADTFFTFQGHLQTPESFSGPQGVGVAADGTVYVIDALNDRIQVFDASGAFREIWGEPGDGDGQFSFHEEQGRYGGDIAFGSDGTIYVAESNNGRVQTFAPDGTHLATWPISSADGTVPSFLTGIALDENAGRIYVADWNSNKLLVLDMHGAVVDEWSADGAAGTWTLRQATDVAVAADGTVIMVDVGRDRLQFFTPTGELITSWGGKGVDPGRFTGLVSVALDAGGNIYTLDYDRNRIQVFAPSGEVLGVFDGSSGETEYFSNPWSVAISPGGLVYVVDEGSEDGLVAVLRTPLTTAPVATPVVLPATPIASPAA